MSSARALLLAAASSLALGSAWAGKPALAVSPAGTAVCDFRLVQAGHAGAVDPLLKDVPALSSPYAGFTAFQLLKKTAVSVRPGEPALSPFPEAQFEFRLDELGGGRFSARATSGQGASTSSVSLGDFVLKLVQSTADGATLVAYTCRN